MGKKILREFSMVDYFLSILYRAVLIGVMILSFLHYGENPAAFWVIVFLCFLPLILIGSDEIIVYENKVVQKKNSLASLLKIRERVYYIDDMSFATLSVPKESTTGEIAGAVVMTLLLPMNRVTTKGRNPIIFRLVNGETVYFLTGISPAGMQRIADTVNELIYQKENGSGRWGNVDEYLSDIN
ncbi:hypothetical protein [Pinibacter soli]|uniref:PH domain-containing protein n=1 Tax=Pinibacter soli TaxID=3044211 RepID=A0ABT6RAD6_9BACT|nr:hypothetical protein [Pinibacter soli]MDI3319526.1 hypothetical protein [Pinibacter soli]